MICQVFGSTVSEEARSKNLLELWIVGRFLGYMDGMEQEDFEDFPALSEEELWDRISFWSALWASVTPEFRNYSLSAIILVFSRNKSFDKFGFSRNVGVPVSFEFFKVVLRTSSPLMLIALIKSQFYFFSGILPLNREERRFSFEVARH